MPWAVSGRRYALLSSDRTAPTYVSNMRLNMRGSVSVPGLSASGPTIRPYSYTGNCTSGTMR